MINFKKYNKINMQIIFTPIVWINKLINQYFKINIKVNILKKLNQFQILSRRSNKIIRQESFNMQVISMSI